MEMTVVVRSDGMPRAFPRGHPFRSLIELNMVKLLQNYATQKL
jgi:hypothetical protein